MSQLAPHTGIIADTYVPFRWKPALRPTFCVRTLEKRQRSRGWCLAKRRRLGNRNCWAIYVRGVDFTAEDTWEMLFWESTRNILLQTAVQRNVRVATRRVVVLSIDMDYFFFFFFTDFKTLFFSVCKFTDALVDYIAIVKFFWTTGSVSID